MKKTIDFPCYINDIVYFPETDCRDEAVIEGIHIDENDITFDWVQYDIGVDTIEVFDDGYFKAEDIGTKVFLTREDKEDYLKNNS